MNAIKAFAEHTGGASGALQSMGDVLLLRGEPIATWSGDKLRFTQGCWHTMEARQVLDALGDALGIGPISLRGRRISQAVWFELQVGRN